MRLGIDLGTTRTIVAVHDRGNYPIVSFQLADGDWVEHYPTVSAAVDGVLVHGPKAEAAERDGAPSLRSWKRLLLGIKQDEPIVIGGVSVRAIELVTGFLESLHADLVASSNAANLFDGTLEAVVSVPANAHSTQRFITLDGFRRAGFEVLSVINEPSAAGIEYAHRHKNTLTKKREHVIVYDLGGGTFDAALVHIAAGHHDIELTSGVALLGGDDFDAQLCAMALERAKLNFPLPPAVRADLLRECRAVKEAVHPNTKRIVVELSALGDAAPDEPIILPVAEYYERVRPLVEDTLQALEPVLEALRDEEQVGGDLAGIYMVGGASGLPIVPRIVKERFGRRVHRSPHPASATAMGCAILASQIQKEAGSLLIAERFPRHFGVFREADHGGRTVFDPVFSKGTPMPLHAGVPLVATRRYQAAHDVGHFRFVESAEVDEHGDPAGDITPHREVVFAFFGGEGPTRVQRLAHEGPWVEERYEVAEGGAICVTITNLDQGHHARFTL